MPEETDDTVHAQHRAAQISALVPGLNLEWVGGGKPLQGFGTWTHAIRQHSNTSMVIDRVYFRFRHDSAQLYIGPAGGKDSDAGDEMPTDPPRLYAEIHGVTGEQWAGSLDDAQITELIPALFDALLPYDSEARPTHRDRLASMIADSAEIWISTGTIEEGLDRALSENEHGGDGSGGGDEFGPVMKERELNQ